MYHNHVREAELLASKQIADACRAAMKKGALPERDIPVPSIEKPRDPQNGDYASSFAMQTARLFGMAPAKIAAAIAEEFQSDLFSSCEIAGPGFINLRLSDRWYGSVVEDILAAGDRFGYTESESPRRIMVEFVSANPTGPMHLGNARGGVLGDCLAEVLHRSGNEVTREFYVNDTGNQIEKFAQSLNARYMQIFEPDYPFPQDGYQGEDIRQLAREFYELNGDAARELSEQERKTQLSRFGLDRNIPKMKADLERYGISYDRWFCESELYEDGYVPETMDMLTERGWTYEKDGALWLRTSELMAEKLRRQGKSDADIEKLELKDDVLRRANGFYTYFASDIAYHRNKLEKRGYDLAINVWGADHHGHVARLEAALDALGLDGEHRLKIVLMQLVRLMQDGEVARMSKRTGNAITLTTLLDEISRDAARFFFNSRAADSHLEFDLDLAVRQDSENPVYYVQYAHARIKSILASLEQVGYDTSLKAASLDLLTAPEERDLIKELARLPEEIRLSAVSLEPSRLNRYAMNTAAAFHRFYTACRIRDVKEKPLRNARIALCRAAAQTIKNTLDSFGVSAPDHM